jgi:hypothetical protein
VRGRRIRPGGRVASTASAAAAARAVGAAAACLSYRQSRQCIRPCSLLARRRQAPRRLPRGRVQPPPLLPQRTGRAPLCTPRSSSGGRRRRAWAEAALGGQLALGAGGCGKRHSQDRRPLCCSSVTGRVSMHSCAALQFADVLFKEDQGQGDGHSAHITAPCWGASCGSATTLPPASRSVGAAQPRGRPSSGCAAIGQPPHALPCSARQHTSPDGSRRLPRLRAGPKAGAPSRWRVRPSSAGSLRGPGRLRDDTAHRGPPSFFVVF